MTEANARTRLKKHDISEGLQRFRGIVLLMEELEA
jgi:hypothetical protein